MLRKFDVKIMEETFIYISVFAIMATIFNSFGIFAIFKYKEWAKKAKTYFICFAAGLLISTPLLIVLPNAVKNYEYAGFFALGGFLFMYFMNKLISHKTKQKKTEFGITAVLGIGVHSFIDGLIYTITFQESILTGVLAASGLVIHEFAEGIITYIMLLEGGTEEKKAKWYAFIIAALTTPIGAFIGYPFIRNVSKDILGMLLGIVAGVIIYVSASHLLPEGEKESYEEGKPHSYLAFILGIVLAVYIVLGKIL